MNIAYVGDFHNYGYGVATNGTPIVYLMSEFASIDKIDVFCPKQNQSDEPTYIPVKVKINPTYDSLKPLSILNLYGINWKQYDLVIFNLMPTVFGRSSIMNLLGLLVPIVLSKTGIGNIKIIYHNSTYTNNVEALGYNSKVDKLRKLVLSRLEKKLFTAIPTYFPLRMYAKKVKHNISNANVGSINMRNLEGITSVYIRGKQHSDKINTQSILDKKSKKKILMHGYWGPQKDLELGLKALQALKNEGFDFEVVISGGVNHHFPDYSMYFERLLIEYKDVITKYRGYVQEVDILSLFIESDLLILPYGVSAGHSGVLESAIFFELETIAIEFPEYKEQSEGFKFIHFCSKTELRSTINEVLTKNTNRDSILVKNKIAEASNNLKLFIGVGP